MPMRRASSVARWGLALSAVLAAQSVPAAVAAAGPDGQTPAAVLARGAVVSLDEAVAEALRANPALAAERASARAMAEVPAQERTLPDPDLMISAMSLPVDSFSFSREPMTQFQVGISQRVSFPGKLGLREKSAAAAAAAAEFGVEETRLRLIQGVRVVWWEMFYLDRALEIVARNQELLRQFVTIAQTKYKVGQGLQQDVLLAQLELSKLIDGEIDLSAQRRQQEDRFNALLSRPVGTAAPVPGTVPEGLPAPEEEARLLEAAEQRRALLAAQRSRVEAVRSRRDLARRDYYPDFMVGASYGFRQGQDAGGSARPDLASLTFSMNLPLRTGGRQDRAVDQYTGELLREQYLLAETRNQVASEIVRLAADYRRAYRQAELFRDGIIPQSRQTVASMLAGYQVNKVDFLNLVRAQITLYDYETRYWRVLSEANQLLARLAAAVGEETL